MLFEFPYIPEKPVQSLCFMKHKIISVCKFVNYVHIDSLFFFSTKKSLFVPNAILVQPLVDLCNYKVSCVTDILFLVLFHSYIIADSSQPFKFLYADQYLVPFLGNSKFHLSSIPGSSQIHPKSLHYIMFVLLLQNVIM